VGLSASDFCVPERAAHGTNLHKARRDQSGGVLAENTFMLLIGVVRRGRLPSRVFYREILFLFTGGTCRVIPVALVVNIFKAVGRSVVAANCFSPDYFKKLSQRGLGIRGADLR